MLNNSYRDGFSHCRARSCQHNDLSIHLVDPELFTRFHVNDVGVAKHFEGCTKSAVPAANRKGSTVDALNINRYLICPPIPESLFIGF